MPEEFREETEQLMRQLDANMVELARQTEEVYGGAGEMADQKAFANWVENSERASDRLPLRSSPARTSRGLALRFAERRWRISSMRSI